MRSTPSASLLFGFPALQCARSPTQPMLFLRASSVLADTAPAPAVAKPGHAPGFLSLQVSSRQRASLASREPGGGTSCVFHPAWPSPNREPKTLTIESQSAVFLMHPEGTLCCRLPEDQLFNSCRNRYINGSARTLSIAHRKQYAVPCEGFADIKFSQGASKSFGILIRYRRLILPVVPWYGSCAVAPARNPRLLHTAVSPAPAVWLRGV